MEFNSIWQWVTWAILVPLFFLCFAGIEKLSWKRYPLPASDSAKRQLFVSFWFMILLFVFLMIWAYWLEWIYN